jgi:Holliday junction resolvase RusA-like endonuclease
MKTAALKEMQMIRPTVVRGDVDNYIKLILDVLHNIVYDDDAHVINIKSEKYYSLYPRVELDIKIRYEV